jgi:ATP-dependent DNA ligase
VILEIFEELKENGSIIKKKEILSKNKDNKTFVDVLHLALSPRIKYYIKKIPNYTPTGELTLDDVLPNLKEFYTRSKTGNEAVDYLETLLSSLSERDAQVLIKIIEKDLKCGTNASLINAIIPKLIEETPYMGASGYNLKNLERMLKLGGVYSEIKMDGQYANGIIKDDVVFESRQGNVTYLDGIFDSLAILSKEYGDMVLNGELIMNGYDRYTSNGMISSLVSTMTKKASGKDVTKEYYGFHNTNGISIGEALDKIVYVIWDVIPYETYLDGQGTVGRAERLTATKNIVEFLKNKGVNNVRIIEYKLCSTKEEVFEHFQELLSEGQEGTIVKEASGTWKDGKPKSQMKFKLELDLDLLVTGLNEGSKNTKFEGKYSSLQVETACGQLVTNPAGINEAMIDYITENSSEMLGKIVMVTCSGLSKDRQGNYSLLHPRFKGFRDDKITVDSLEDCIRKEQEKKGLL